MKKIKIQKYITKNDKICNKRKRTENESESSYPMKKKIIKNETWTYPFAQSWKDAVLDSTMDEKQELVLRGKQKKMVLAHVVVVVLFVWHCLYVTY